MIRRALILLYLALVVLLATGVGVVGEAVSEYGVKLDERQSTVQRRLRQIFTERQESVEQEQQEAAEAVQIAHRWRVRAVQLAQFIERQGLSVPAPTVPLRVPPLPEPSPGGGGGALGGAPGTTPGSPPPPVLPVEPTPFEPPGTPEPEVTCIPLPEPVPDFCVQASPTPNP